MRCPVRRNRSRAFLAALVLFTLGLVPALPAAAQDYRPGEVLVRFRPTASAASIQAIKDDLGADRVRQFTKLRIEYLRISNASVDEALARYRTHPAVEVIEPNFIYRSCFVPNDPMFSQLWGMQNTGQTGGTPGADISAVQAWDVFTGSPSVLVGVIDTGVDYTHPDLAPNMFTNLNEIPGNFTDDDGNGFVDDVRGWDFVNNDNDPFDDAGHGTHCSGTIGAVGNDGIGVAGVSWQVRILPIKFLDAFGSGSTEGAIASVDYARTMGVQIISASWGGTGNSELLRSAIESFNNAGGLFVAAAGNAALDTDVFPFYPSAYDLPRIVAVAASTHNDVLAGFSNFGVVSVDLAAPGEGILSTVPGAGYATFNGTSMAAPHVSGALALMLGRFPAMDPDAAKSLLLSRADPLPALAGRVLSGSRLNAFMVIAEADSIPPGAISDLSVASTGGQNVTLHWTAPGDDGPLGTAARYDVRYSTSQITEENFLSATAASGTPTPLPAGSAQEMIVPNLDFSTTYHFAIRTHDEFGTASVLSNKALGTTLGPPDVEVSPLSVSADLFTGQTATRTVTIANHGVSDLVFETDVESVEGVTVDILPAAQGASQTLLGRGTPMPLEQLAAARVSLPANVEVAPTDRDAFASRVSGRAAVEAAPGRIVLSPTEEVFGNTAISFFGGTRMRGNIFQCTTERLLREHRLFLGPNFATRMWFLVYEGAAAVGNFDLISVSHLPSAGPGLGWYSSGTVDVPLMEGRFYLILASFEEASGYFGSDFLPVYPITASFGQLIAGAGATWAPPYGVPPPPSQFVPPDAYGLPVAYYQTLITDRNLRWLTANPASGSVAAGGALDLAVNFDAAGLNGGDYESHLAILSNDPDESRVDVTAQLHVTGAPDISVEPDSLDFGHPFVGVALYDTVDVRNAGTDLLIVSGVDITPSEFETETSGFSLAPGETRRLPVRFLAATPGVFPGSLTVHSNDVDEAQVTVALHGEGLLPPDIAVQPESLLVGLLSGERVTRMLTISNTGFSDLEFSIALREVGGAAPRVVNVRTVPIEDPSSGAEARPRTDRTPAGYVPTAFAGRTVGGAQALLVYDFLPWGQNANQVVLEANGIAYDVTGTAQLGSIDLDTYRLIIVASDQSTSSYLNIASQADRLDDFVQGGGQLEFHAAGWGFQGGDASVVTLPGGVGITPYSAGTNFIVLPDHPLVQGLPSAFFGNSASHSYLSNVPAHAQVVTTDEVGRVTLAEYYLGLGRVVVSCQTLEFYAPQPGNPISILHSRLIPYSLSGGGVPWLSAEPVQGTVPAGGTAEIAIEFNADDLLGGGYDALIQVRSNDPDEVETRVPAHMDVTGVPHLTVRGELQVVESVQTYSQSGATTTHDLLLPQTPPADGDLNLHVDGDFGDFSETASLYVEGSLLGSVGEVFIDCQPDSGDFHLDAGQLAAYAADGVVHALIQNSPAVDPFCGTERHRLRLSYHLSADPVAFGVNLLGQCRTMAIELENSGTDVLVVHTIGSNSPDFVPALTNLTLAPRARAMLPVTFCPSATGPAAGTLSIASNDPDLPVRTFSMNGLGTLPPDIALAPEEVFAELGPNETATREVTISNHGQGPLVWRASVAGIADSGAVVVASPVMASTNPHPATKEPRATGESWAGGKVAPVVSAAPEAPGVPAGSTLALRTLSPRETNGFLEPSLEDVLHALDANFAQVTALIPNRFDFSEGVNGTGIGDGGNDMYDFGNLLGTNLGSALEYSDGVIRTSPFVGPGGRYFTRKYPGLFVFVADLDGATNFDITGNLGADNGGNVDAAILEQFVGGSIYRGFVKRVFNAFDPSVNHLVILRDAEGVNHEWAPNTDNDFHRVFGLTGSRLYYLLYAGQEGGYIDNPTTLGILNEFLEQSGVGPEWLTVAPITGGAPAGGATQAQITFHSEGLLGGMYVGSVAFDSNDPDESRGVVSAHLRVIGIPQIAAAPESLDFGTLFVGLAASESVEVRNIGTDLLTVSNVEIAPPAFGTDLSGFTLAPGARRILAVNFAPSVAVEAVGSLTVHSDDPDTPALAVALRGQGILPPDIAVAPESLSVAVMSGDSLARTLTITNTGASDLTFAIGFGNDLGAAVHETTVRSVPSLESRRPIEPSNRAPADYVPSASTPRTEGDARVLLVQDAQPWGTMANEMALEGIGIPYHVIPSTALQLVDLEAYDVVIVPGDQYTATYVNLAARAAQLDAYVQNGGQLEFHAFGWGWNGGDASLVTLPGGVGIAYFNSTMNHVLMPDHPLVTGFPASFFGPPPSIAFLTNLPPAASVVIGDDLLRPTFAEYPRGFGRVVVACQPLEYSASYDTGTPIAILHSRLIPYTLSGSTLSWISADPREGSVPAGSTLEVTIQFRSEGAPAGILETQVLVQSNDPDEPVLSVPARMQVIGVPNIAVQPSNLNFGVVLIGETGTLSVEVENVGTDLLTVSGVEISPAEFQTDPSGFVLEPGASLSLAVDFSPVDAGEETGVLTLHSNDPNDPTILVPLHAEGRVPPEIDVTPTSIDVALGSGESTTRNLTLSNTGGTDLQFTISFQDVFSGLARVAGVRSGQSAGMIAETATDQRTNQAPPGYVPTLSQPDTAGEASVLLVQDVLPWGRTSNQDVLAANGIAFDVVGTAELPFVNLGSYRSVIVAGDQFTQSYTNLAAQAVQLATYVQNGGRLEFHAAGWGFHGGNASLVTLPGGVGIVSDPRERNIVLLPAHPLAAGLPASFDASYASLAYLTNIPPQASVVIADDRIDRATLIDYRFGIGRVIAGTQPLEFYAPQLGTPISTLHSNMILYGLAGLPWLTANPLTGSVSPGSSAEIVLTFNAADLTPGTYDALVVVESNDQDEDPFPVQVHLEVAMAASVSAESAPERLSLAPVAPNPGRGLVRSEYALPRPGTVHAAIFDVRGRRVRTLDEGPRPAGRHALLWRGEDNQGVRSAPGIYLLKLASEQGTLLQRFVWLP
ncbi:MAG: choice-of-anchor D domain-containing protein [Candidatus Eiseniibacteriota bacterium]